MILVALWGCGGGTAATLVVAEAVAPAEAPPPEPAPTYVAPTVEELITRCEGTVAPTSPSFHPPEWFLAGREHEPLYAPIDELERRGLELRTQIQTGRRDDPRHAELLRELGAVSCEMMSASRESYAEWGNDCVRVYAQIVEDHPDYERMDDVLYELACALDHFQVFDRSRQVLWRLMRLFTQSRWIGAAYGRFARFYRDAGDPDAARQFWSKVADDNPESSLAGYAHYDLGWIATELGYSDSARNRWIEALSWIEMHADAPLAIELARAIEHDFCAALSPQPNAPDPPPP